MNHCVLPHFLFCYTRTLQRYFHVYRSLSLILNVPPTFQLTLDLFTKQFSNRILKLSIDFTRKNELQWINTCQLVNAIFLSTDFSTGWWIFFWLPFYIIDPTDNSMDCVWCLTQSNSWMMIYMYIYRCCRIFILLCLIGIGICQWIMEYYMGFRSRGLARI